MRPRRPAGGPGEPDHGAGVVQRRREACRGWPPEPRRSAASRVPAGIGRAKRWPWPAVQPSSQRAPALRLALHALGDHVEAEAAAEVEGGADDGGGLGGALHGGRRSCGRSSARARGCGRAATARSSRCRSRRGRAGCPASRSRLSTRSTTSSWLRVSVSVSSRTSRSGGRSWARSRASTGAGEAGVEQAAGRDVDRDRHVEAGVAPAARGDQRLVEDRLGEGGEQAGAFHRLQEAQRVDHPVGGVVPAGQRLGADDLAAAEVDDGLEVDGELVVGDRAGQFAAEGEPAEVGGVAGRGVRRRSAGRPAWPGTWPRRRGAAARHAAAGGCGGDAAAGLDADPHAVQVERLVQRGEQGLGPVRGHRRGRQTAQEYGELVAAEPGHQVAVAGRRRAAARRPASAPGRRRRARGCR